MDRPAAPRPRQNRVLPTGEIVAAPVRGTLMGNRGCLHDAEGRLGQRRWRSAAWITCVLDFKDRRRAVMTPGRYTELFFLDEATSLAAGHRPCAECRRVAYRAWQAAWRRAIGPWPGAKAADARLHASRLVDGTRAQARHMVELGALPGGVFVIRGRTPHLWWQSRLWPWQPEGYGAPQRAPGAERVEVLTPKLTVALLRQGYSAGVHESAAAQREI